MAGGSRDEVPRIVTPPPGPKSREILARQEKVLYPGLAHDLAPLITERRDGWTVTDADGNVYLDMVCASASIPFGAGRPEVVDAAVEALRRFGNEDSHGLAHPFVLPLAERLLEIAPGPLTRVDISLNGTESVETAVRFMRRATGRAIVIGFMGAYHGEAGTAGAVGAEASALSRGYRAALPGYAHVPYPNPYRSPFTARPGGSGDGTIDFLRDHLLFHVVDPGEVAGVVIEPVMGSGGCVSPPDAFWPALVELCREHDWLLCADEVKTGFGRTGHLFAVERWGVEPDLLALGKAMGGGAMPIGAVLGTERAMGFDDLSTGSTWSWLPAACAAALETIEVFAREPVLDNVRAIEAEARRLLAPLAERYPSVGDVRAVGCFIAIEFVRDRGTKERDPALTERVAAACLRRGLLVDPSTTSLNVQPSLVMPPELMEVAATILVEAIDESLAAGA
jgi:4-aminobutyrate aminotransferase-like enzyme